MSDEKLDLDVDNYTTKDLLDILNLNNVNPNKRAYFIVLARTRICNPNDEASQYKVNLVLVNYFFTL